MEKIIIKPNLSETEKKYFNNQWLIINGFDSNIQGLSLCLQNANGISKKISIADTKLGIRENVTDYGYFWFEYLKTDQEYEILVSFD